MDAVTPWAALEALVRPHYAVAGNGRRPLPLATMLRIYFLQQWFDLSDPAAEDMLYDSESMRRCARIELGEDHVPDETTILKFRHLLERHRLTAQQTRKGNQWYFGRKRHIGTDRRGVIHSLVTTDAAAADITQLPHLLHGQETTLHGDKAYDKAEDKLQWELSGGRYLVNKSGPRTTYKDAINRTRLKPRARVEHAFPVIKRVFGFTKVRYRGLVKNTVRAYAACALANRFRMRVDLRAYQLQHQGT
jgi:IS5 family transposase